MPQPWDTSDYFNLSAQATGGFSRMPHTAVLQHSVSPHGLVNWAEPSTGGEAFIPLNAANRQRSLGIWTETGKRLGAKKFDRGGINTGNPKSGLLQVIWDNTKTGEKVGEAGGQRVGPGTSQPGYYGADWSGHTGHVHTSFATGPSGEFYGLKKGTDIRQGKGGFPAWVYSLGRQFGLEPSTYAGHQEGSGWNRGIDWWPAKHADMSGNSYSKAERHRLDSFAKGLTSFASRWGRRTRRMAGGGILGGDTSDTSGDNWDLIAQGESGGNWSINTGNGYFGGLQFNQATWDQFGGQEFATRPDLATRDQQITVAERVPVNQRAGRWPNTYPLGAGKGSSQGSVGGYGPGSGGGRGPTPEQQLTESTKERGLNEKIDNLNREIGILEEKKGKFTDQTKQKERDDMENQLRISGANSRTRRRNSMRLSQHWEQRRQLLRRGAREARQARRRRERRWRGRNLRPAIQHDAGRRKGNLSAARVHRIRWKHRREKCWGTAEFFRRSARR